MIITIRIFLINIEPKRSEILYLKNFFVNFLCFITPKALESQNYEKT